MTIALLIKCIIGVAAVAIATPTILFCFFPQVVRAWFEGGADAVESVGPHESKAVAVRLKEMGFRALGVKAEKLPIRARVRELSFVASDNQCYASVLAGRRAYLYYYTPFADGGFVLTSNGPIPRIESGQVVQRSYLGCEAQDLLHHHVDTVSKCGRQAKVVASAEARIEATYAFYRTPETRRALRRRGATWLACGVIVGWLLVR